MKPLIQAVLAATFVAAGAQYTVVDAQGHVVGTLVTDTPPPPQLRLAGPVAHATELQPNPNAPRAFGPDYSKALSVDQMTRAWRDELDRISPPVVTGGG